MTYKQYLPAILAYEKAISDRKSLQTTIRTNIPYLKTYTPNMSNAKRLNKINAAKNALSQLDVPPKPVQPIGYQLLNLDGDFLGFYNTDDKTEVQELAKIALGHTDFTLVAKPRFRDD